MKRNGRKYAIVMLFTGLINSVNIHAEISTQALLDLTTCYGADFPAAKFQAGVDKDPRIRSMEQTLSRIRTMESVKSTELDGFYTPRNENEILGNPIQFIGLYGYSLLSGVNLVLGGIFDVIKSTLEEQRDIQYSRCDGKSSHHLKVCHQDITTRYSHMIMTHPHIPKHQVILICVDKQAKSS
ncbi:MAG: hypothetical protein KZQ96_07020 [Candidatus Thiodiazotropha sp. (ex Lucinoma borealis)]|nr:hypothetical protein [Candidatus Thiodiazotropha sp. (ex Lucinoma borealis)]